MVVSQTQRFPPFVKVSAPAQLGANLFHKIPTHNLLSKEDGSPSFEKLDTFLQSVLKSADCSYSYLDCEGDPILIKSSKEFADALSTYCFDESVKITAQTTTPERPEGDAQGVSELQARIKSLEIVVEEIQSRTKEELQVKDEQVETLKKMVEVQNRDIERLSSQVGELTFCYRRAAGPPQAIRSAAHGTYLRGTAGDDGAANMVGYRKNWETWTLLDLRGSSSNSNNTWVIYNRAHGNYLSARKDMTVGMVTWITDAEKFEIVDLGQKRIAFKSHFGTFLRAPKRSHEPVNLAKQIAEWEMWTVQNLK